MDKIGFDSNNNVLITYHKHDNNGNTQGYITRYNNNNWEIVKLSNWDYRWNFEGGGSIGKGHVMISPAKVDEGNVLKVNFEHIKYGKGYWLLDEISLSPIEEIITGESDGYGPTTDANQPLVMNKKIAADTGSKKGNGKSFILEWYTYPANRDTVRTTAKATPSMLQVVETNK